MGIDVATATDAAKAAAGIVLTLPGLTGIVASVKEGRMRVSAHPHLHVAVDYPQSGPGAVPGHGP